MAKKKKVYIVYVNEKVRNDADLLFNAVFDHLVKKGMDIAQRKRFMTEFMRAPITAGDKARFGVIERWVQVRDLASFPLGNKPKQVTDGDEDTPNTEADTDDATGDTGGVSVDSESTDTGAAPE